MGLKKLFLGLLLFTAAFTVKAANYYWVGSSTGITSYWDQVENWKVDGMPASSIPSSGDDVFFDKAGAYAIMLRRNESCRNFTVLGGSPRLQGLSNVVYYIYTYGSVEIIPALVSSNNSVRFHFKSNSTATYKSNGAPLWHHMLIDKEGGELTILDDFKYNYIDFYAGKLIFAPDLTVNLEYFRSNYASNLPRILDLNNARINVLVDWLYTGTNAEFIPGNSFIEMKRGDGGGFNFHGVNSHVYNKVHFINTLATTYNTQSNLKNASIKEVLYTVANRNGSNLLRIEGTAVDSCKIGTLKTNTRVDLVYTVADSAEYKTKYSLFAGHRAHVKNLYLEGSGAFQDVMKVDTLAISYGQYYSFNQNQKYQIFDHFRLLGDPCAGPFTLECGNSNVANMAEFVKTSGSLDILYGRIINIKTSGGAVFNCAGYNHNGTSVGWNFTDYVAPGKDLYWIGGGGSQYWHTPEAWSLTSGGAPANCVPSQYDNVFFDNNSGLTATDRVIRMRGGIRAYTKDLNFVGDPGNLPYFDMVGSRGFDVYGSLVLNPGVAFSTNNAIDSIRFLSSLPGNTITSNGVQPIRISFSNPTGEWTLMDDLTMAGGHIIKFNQGTLNTNNKNVNFYQFYSPGTGVRSLILGSSVLSPKIGGNNQWGWYYDGKNMTLDAGTSLMNMGNASIVSDTLLVYNRIKVDGTNQSTIQTIKAKHVELIKDPNNAGHTTLFRGNVVLDSLVAHRIVDFYNTAKIKNAQLFHNGTFRTSLFFDTIMFGGNGTTYLFAQGTTQTISSKISSLAVGCDGFSAFYNISNPASSTAKIKIPATETFQINGAKIRGMEGVDGTFMASGDDEGGNVNWTFVPPMTKDIYWVGGSGDWHDIAHWSGTSGGAGGFCLPTQYDNVFFDHNSNLVPTDDFLVYAPNPKIALCRDMTWSGVLGANKKILIENSLVAYGSIDLQADVDYFIRYFRLWAHNDFVPATVKTNGAVIYSYLIFGEADREAYGSWKLLDKLTMGRGSIKIGTTNYALAGHVQVLGTFDTDGHDIYAMMYRGLAKSVSYWRNSTIEILHWTDGANYQIGIPTTGVPTKLYAEDAELIVDQKHNQNIEIGLHGVKIKKVVVFNSSADPNVYFDGNFTIDYLDVQTSINTRIVHDIIAKRVDAHKGIRFHRHATVDTFNVGTGDYVFFNNTTLNFKIIRDFPSKCVSQRTFNAQNGKINIEETFSLTNTDFTNTNILGANAPFNVTGTAAGTNTGLNISEPNKTTLYLVTNVALVNNVAIVYWDDTTAWSFTSGGAPSGCYPGRWTNVVIDDNSYTGSPTAILQLRPGLRNIYNKCYNFTSTRTTRTQYYTDRNSAYQSLWVYGSIDFNSTSELYFDQPAAPLYLMAENPQTLTINHLRGRVYFQGTGAGSWTLQRDLVNDVAHNNHFYFRSGDLILNGHKFQSTYIHEDVANNKGYSIDMNNSDINVCQLLLPGGVLKNTENTSIYFNNRASHAYFRSKQGANPYKFQKLFYDIAHNTNSGGSHAVVETDLAADTLLVRNSTTGGDKKFIILDTINVKVFKTMRLAANTPAVHTLQLERLGDYGSFYSDAPIVNINGDNSFDTLDIAQNSPVYTLAAGTKQTIREKAYMSGSPCKFTTFRSATNGLLANLVIPKPMTVDFDIFAYIHAKSYDGTPGNVLTAERNCTEEGGTFNQGITFINKPKTLVGLGEDLTACFRDFPYTISSAGFFAGPAAKYEWCNSANQIVGTAPNLVITVPGKYSIKVDYDPLYTCNQADEVTILRGASITPVIVWDTVRPVCHKDSLVLTISNPVGAGYQYAMKDTADRTPIVSQVSPVFNNVKHGTYYLIVDSAQCFSSTRLVTIREPYRAGIATDIIISDASTCYNTSATLSPKAGIGLDSVFYWYYDAALTNPIAGIGADGVFTTPLITVPTTYYVTTSSDTVCQNIPGTAKAVNVTVRALPTLSLDNNGLVSCGGNDGIVTVTTFTGVAPFEYSKDGTTWQASNIFTALTVGTHEFWVKDANGCISLPEEITLTGVVSSNPNARSYSDGPATYGIAENKLVECIYLGSLDTLKKQTVAAPSALANTALNDDGITILEVGGYTDLSQANFKLLPNGDLEAKVRATNHYTAPSTVTGWIDFDRNGVYDETYAVESVLAGTTNEEITLTWFGAAALMKNGETYMRLRTTSHPNYFDPEASQENGEVEDYRLNFRLFDIKKSVSKDNAKIGDTLQYTLLVTNQSTIDLDNIFLFDPLPAETKFIEADNGGALAVVNVDGTNVNSVAWPLFNLAAGGANVTRTFKALINEIPNGDSIYNTAHSIVNVDTIPSNIAGTEVERLIAEDDCFAVLKNGTIAQAAISMNDSDSLRNFVRDTILHVGGNTAHGGKAVLNVTPKGTMEYKAGSNYVGLDTVHYRIKTNKHNADAKAVIAVIEFKSDNYLGCPNSTVKVEVEAIDNVVFEWFTVSDTSLIALGNFVDIILDTKDTVIMVRPIISGCATNAYFKIPIGILPPPQLPDIRVQVCATPSRQINLSSYLDSVQFMSYSWTALAASPAIVPGTASTTGTISTSEMTSGLSYQYSYDYINKCGAGQSKLFFKSLANTGVTYPAFDTIVVCINNAKELNLNRIIGLEVSGTWDYGIPLNPDVTLSSYVKHKLPDSDYSGAYIFDVASAYTNTSNIYLYPGGYWGDTDAKVFKFNYTTAANCGPVETRKIVLIVTSKLVGP